jgi:hypothetical protein
VLGIRRDLLRPVAARVFEPPGTADDEERLLSAELPFDVGVDLVAVRGDGDLTKKELEKADSLVIGAAEQFVIHLENPDASLLTVSSRGALEDGRSFRVEYSRVDGEVKKSEVTID